MTRALSESEIGKAWKSLQRRVRAGDALAERDAAVFALIVWAGLKPCECCGLNVEDVMGNGRHLAVAEVRVTVARELPGVQLPGINPVHATRRAPILGPGRDYLTRLAAKLHTEEAGAGARPFIRRDVKGEARRLTRWTIRDCWLRAVALLAGPTCDAGRATYAVAMLKAEPFDTVMKAMGITHRHTLKKYVGIYKAAATTE